jgi:hypothetical protein
MIRYLLILLACLPAYGATVYVATNGNDGALGTLAAPWRTVQRGLTGALTGDILLIGAGTYPESIQTRRAGVTIDGQGVATIYRMHLAQGHSNTVVQNLTFKGWTTLFSQQLYIDRSAHNLVVSNCDFDLNGTAKIKGIDWKAPSTKPFGTDATSDSLIISNRVRNSSGYILMSIYGDRNVIRGNRMGDSPQGDFFNLWGRSNLITGNICSNLPYAEGLGNHPDFIQTFGNHGYGSAGHRIERNFVYGIRGGQLSQLTGQLVPEIGNWLFVNNVFSDILLQGSCTIPGIKYYNNLFVRCNYNSGNALTFGQRTYAGIGTEFSDGSEALNNVFLACGSGNNNSGWYSFIGFTNRFLQNVRADFNYVAKADYLPPKLNTLQQVVGDPGGWNHYAWYEPNGHVGNGTPIFENYYTGDFRIKTNAAILNAGTNLSAYLTNDYFGNPRTGWNIGPFETGADLGSGSGGGGNSSTGRVMRVNNLRIQSITFR